MENKSHAMAAGSFVLAVTLLLFSLAVWLTRDKGRYQIWELSTRDSVTGLQPQAPVRYKGVAVGKVTYIGFDDTARGNVVIRISVEEHTPLTPTTYATLSYQGVTGLAYVLLDDSGTEQKQILPGEDGIARLPLVTSQLGKLTEQAPELLAQINEVTQRINQTLSDENQKSLALTLKNLSDASAGIAQLSASLQDTARNRINPALAAMPAVMLEAAQTLSAIQATAKDAAHMSGEIARSARRLNEKDGPLNRLAEGSKSLVNVADTLVGITLPRVNQLADDGTRLSRQLGRAANEFSDQPQSLIYGRGVIPPGPGEPGFAPPQAARP
jgi:phospholipid/cholesterol/gamma-HCH transport system substrate-binding protein